jgi:hypothetical protein
VVEYLVWRKSVNEIFWDFTDENRSSSDKKKASADFTTESINETLNAFVGLTKKERKPTQTQSESICAFSEKTFRQSLQHFLHKFQTTYWRESTIKQLSQSKWRLTFCEFVFAFIHITTGVFSFKLSTCMTKQNETSQTFCRWLSHENVITSLPMIDTWLWKSNARS